MRKFACQWLAVLVVLWSGVMSSVVFAQPPTVRLAYTASEGCPAKGAFEDWVREIVADDPFHDESERIVEVTVTNEGTQALGVLAFLGDERRAHGGHCDEVVESLAVVLAVRLDSLQGVTPSGVHPLSNRVRRPLTLPEGSLQATVHGGYAGNMRGFGRDDINFEGGDNERFFILGSVRYSLLDDLEVGLAGVRPGLQTNSGFGIAGPQGDFSFTNPSVFARWRTFQSKHVDLGLDMTVDVPVDGFTAAVGIPVRVRDGIFSLDFRVDVALVLSGRELPGLPDAPDGVVQIAIAPSVALGEHWYVTANVMGKILGWGFSSTDGDAFGGLEVGATIPIGATFWDLYAGFNALLVGGDLGSELYFDLGARFLLDGDG